MSADAGSAVNHVRNPFVESPFVDKPFVDKPLVDRPFVERPLVDKPLVESPFAEMIASMACAGASACSSATRGAPQPVSAVASTRDSQRDERDEGMRGGLT